MENASGRATLSSSIRSSLRTLFLSPRTILLSKPSFLIFCLYGGGKVWNGGIVYSISIEAYMRE